MKSSKDKIRMQSAVHNQKFLLALLLEAVKLLPALLPPLLLCPGSDLLSVGSGESQNRLGTDEIAVGSSGSGMEMSESYSSSVSLVVQRYARGGALLLQAGDPGFNSVLVHQQFSTHFP